MSEQQPNHAEDNGPLILDPQALADEVAAFAAQDFAPLMQQVLDGEVPATVVPELTGPITTVLSTRMPTDVYLELGEYAEQRGTTPGALVRQWIIDRLAAERGRATQPRVISREQLLAIIEQMPDAA